MFKKLKKMFSGFRIIEDYAGPIKNLKKILRGFESIQVRFKNSQNY